MVFSPTLTHASYHYHSTLHQWIFPLDDFYFSICTFLIILPDTHHTEPPIQSNRRRRSTTPSPCSTNQQSNNSSSPPHQSNIHSSFTQTLTTLNLCWNEIGPQGTQHIASALQINKVTILLLLLLINPTFTHPSHRHSPHLTSPPIKSETKEHNT